MILLMPKTTSINLRISPEFRDEIERLAAYHGLTMSSYAHSLLVKTVRREREATPEAFDEKPRGVKAVRSPVVMRIEPGHAAAERRRIERELDEPLATPTKRRKTG